MAQAAVAGELEAILNLLDDPDVRLVTVSYSSIAKLSPGLLIGRYSQLAGPYDCPLGARCNPAGSR